MNNKKDIETLKYMRNRLAGKSSYEVGYGKPPKSSQFKKGCSGNPTGRKKKVIPKSIRESLELELTKQLTITNELDKKEKVYLYELLVKQLIKDALHKDGTSRKLLLETLMKIDLLSCRQSIVEESLETQEEQEAEASAKAILIEKLNQILKENENTSL